MDIWIAVIAGVASLVGALGGTWLGKRTASKDAENEHKERHDNKTREAIAELLSMRSEAYLTAYKALAAMSKANITETSVIGRLQDPQILEAATAVERLRDRLSHHTALVKLLINDPCITEQCDEINKTSHEVLEMVVLPEAQRSTSPKHRLEGITEPPPYYEDEFDKLQQRAMELFAKTPESSNMSSSPKPSK